MAKKTAPVKKTKTPARAERTTAKPAPKPAPKLSTTQVRQALEAGQGVLRLAPTWAPRSFLMPGRLLKLHPAAPSALGAHRGGIDERCFASTPPAANENREPDEGLSYVVVQGSKAFTLKDAIELEGPKFVGATIWERYRRWPVYSKFFD